MHKVILGNFFVWKGRTNACIALSNDKLDDSDNHMCADFELQSIPNSTMLWQRWLNVILTDLTSMKPFAKFT